MILGSVQRWLGRKAYAYASRVAKLTDPVLSSWFGGGPTAAGVRVDDDAALRVSTVWSCVRILAETVGALPWGIYERRGDTDSVEVRDHRLAAVLSQPNQDMTSLEFREAEMASLALFGNGYARIERNTRGDLSELQPLPRPNVKVERDQAGRAQWAFLERGKWEPIPSDRLFKLRGFGWSGIEGLSPIAFARESMGLAIATERFGATLFSRGLNPSMIVSVEEWLEPDKAAKAREKLEAQYQGWAGNAGVLFLDGKMKADRASIPPEDAQFIDTQKFTVPQICRFFRVPPHMVFDLERATFSNIEQMATEFVMFDLLPYLVRWEQAISRWLMTPAERSRFFFKFKFEGLLRADSISRSQLYSTLLQNGVLCRNEVRVLENRPRSDAEGMDDFTVQSNMTVIQLLEQLQRANASAAANAKAAANLHTAPRA
jgi:HK97 family phage portal protein